MARAGYRSPVVALTLGNHSYTFLFKLSYIRHWYYYLRLDSQNIRYEQSCNSGCNNQQPKQARMHLFSNTVNHTVEMQRE